MIEPEQARAVFLDHYNPMLRRSEPFGDLVLPSQAASHLMHVSDLVWIKHILADLALAEAERDAWAARIRRDQDPATGLFRYPPGERHVDEHATWQCVAALNMLGRRPRHRLACLEPLATVDGFRAWCEAYARGTSHHRFMLAVLTAASRPVGDDWRQVFGAWYDARQDPETGFPCCSNAPGCLSPAFLLTILRVALCGSVPRPERIVDTVLGFQTPAGAFTESDLPAYMEMDASFLLHLLAPRAEAHRPRIEAALARVAALVEAVLGDTGRRERLLASPHAALAVCGTLSVLRRHFEGADEASAPFPWAELTHYRAPC